MEGVQTLADRRDDDRRLRLPPGRDGVVTGKWRGDEPGAGVVAALIDHGRHGSEARPAQARRFGLQLPCPLDRLPLDEEAVRTCPAWNVRPPTSLAHTAPVLRPPASRATAAGTRLATGTPPGLSRLRTEVVAGPGPSGVVPQGHDHPLALHRVPTSCRTPRMGTAVRSTRHPATRRDARGCRRIPI